MLLPLLLAIGLATPALAAEPDDWVRVTKPSPGPVRVVGKTAQGCIGGAVGLPVEGVGYQALRPTRLRHFGHPDTVRFVEALGRWSAKAGHGVLLIGDMGQPRGGPMPSGHASHQSGLDADIWFRRAPRPLAAAELAQPLAIDMLKPDGKTVDPARFGPVEMEMLRQAASRPEVERILINPALKRAVCERATGDRAWLRRLRPWWGHSAHFHARLSCPAGQSDCEPGPAIPAGDGCGTDLMWWFSADAVKAALERFKPRDPAPPKILPAACMEILAAR
ncbi:penicillin-insensitive murein endopeptidase [Allostella humosa]|nr:penicillin-insensitive murein endopeptidase [Stella humosa]BBK32018.1 penicillin-insensitive murein endopeptidase [Stella humosa]